MRRLDEAILDDISEMSEAEIDADFIDLGLDPAAEAEKTRSAIEAAMKNFAKASLISAKEEVARYKLEQARGARAMGSAKSALDRLRSRDPGFAPMMMAARKGKTLSESDEAGLAEDLADLEKLEKEPD